MKVILSIIYYVILLFSLKISVTAHPGACATNPKMARIGRLTLSVDPRVEMGEELAVKM